MTTRLPPPVLSPREAADWDRLADAQGIPVETLMDAAGRAVAAVTAQRFPAALAGGVLVAVGTGNNGGDGWAAARALAAAGARVWVTSLAGEQSSACAWAEGLARRSGVRTVGTDGPWPDVALVVDAVLGAGARGAPRAPAAALLDRLHDLRTPVVAIDGPTGLDLETGVVHGNARADVSVTFGGARRGHLLARDESGEIVVVDIGLPPASDAWPRLVTDDWAAERLPAFAASAHKGTRGRVVIVGGAPGMGGALRLASRAAFGAGAGYVHAVAPEETVAELHQAEPDLLTLVSALSGAPEADLLELVRRADAVVVGPGLGRGDDRVPFVAGVLAAARRAVVDADALTIFQSDPDELATVLRGRVALITPHPGEFRSLLPDLASVRELDPWSAAQAAAPRVGCTILLKGVPTVVGSGTAAPWTIAAGNPGLGTGGSGDVLSGICGTFLAQTEQPELAGALAGQALGRAGDMAARRHTARAMRPMDVVAALPDVWREWAARRGPGRRVQPPELVRLPRPAEF